MKVKKGKGTEWKVYAESKEGEFIFGIDFYNTTQAKINQIFKVLKDALKDIEP